MRVILRIQFQTKYQRSSDTFAGNFIIWETNDPNLHFRLLLKPVLFVSNGNSTSQAALRARGLRSFRLSVGLT